tara:strand:- start:6304 stop:7095 length:792 start_codon:yes stop_codon:yes gene_type:complete
MKLEILMSCMHQFNFSIIEKAKIESDVLIINQTNLNEEKSIEFENNFNKTFSARMISTKDRGLSKSRNLALKNAMGDICLISDDDEIFTESYKDIIEDTYRNNSKADVIAFALNRPNKTYPKKAYRVGYISALRISSAQISFKRESVQEKGIQFDEKMGSGTGNGGGEENKFIYDCLRKGLKVYYHPFVIADLSQSESQSQWFHGYTRKYLKDKGWAHKKIKGHFIGLLTAIRFVFVKHSLYKNDIKLSEALKLVIKGVFEQR